MFKNLRNKLAVLALVALGLAFGNALGSKPAEPTKTNGELIYDAIMNGQLPDEQTGEWIILPEEAQVTTGQDKKEGTSNWVLVRQPESITDENKRKIKSAIERLLKNDAVVKYITIHNIYSCHLTNAQQAYLSLIGASACKNINYALKRKLDAMDPSMELSLQIEFFDVNRTTASQLQQEYTEKSSEVLYVLGHYFAAQMYSNNNAAELNAKTRNEIRSFIEDFSTDNVYKHEKGLTIAKKKSKWRSLTLDIKNNTVYIKHFGPSGNPQYSK